MDDWKRHILTLARHADRTVFDVAGGLGIGFADGNDVFWLLPGEVSSTVPVEADQPDRLWQEYQRIDGLRDRAVHVLRHYLASKQIQTTRTPSGVWGIATENGVSSTLSVGADLTALARDGDDVYALVRSRFEGGMVVRHAPTPRRIDRYLATPGPPAAEADLDARPESATLTLLRTMPQMLAMIGMCGALHDPDRERSADDLTRAAQPEGPIAQALLRVGERLIGFKLTYELTTHVIDVAFADGQDGFPLDPKSRDLATAISTSGPIAAGDALADTFLALNDARRRALSAVYRAAADRDWGYSRFGGFSLLNIGRTTYLGHTRREVKLMAGPPLTAALRTGTVDAALREILATAPDFADTCVAQLAHDDPAAPIPTLPRRPLEPDPPTTQPALLDLSADTIAAMDAFADEVIAAYRADKDLLRAYREGDHYLPGVDTWISAAAWVQLAKQKLDEPEQQDWADPEAIEVLLDHGEPRGTLAASKRIRQVDPRGEGVWPCDIATVWQFRHERPDLARQWFTPQPDDPVPHAKARAKLGDPVAEWFEAANADPDAADDERTFRVPLPGEDPGSLHARLRHWARTHWLSNPPPAEPLRVARHIGATDVADALADNPHLLPMLLTYAPRAERLDDPGLLLGARFVLAWSALKPTPLMARVVATASLSDVVRTESRRSAEAAARRNPKVAKSLASTFKTFDRYVDQLRPALAIAWTRYRRHAASPTPPN